MLEKGGYVRPREVIAIVAGTRTKSGSTNFLRLHVMGENAAAQAHPSTAAQSAPAGKKSTARSARSLEAQKPEFSEAARSLAAKY
jgi:pyruvate kinase